MAPTAQQLSRQRQAKLAASAYATAAHEQRLQALRRRLLAQGAELDRKRREREARRWQRQQEQQQREHRGGGGGGGSNWSEDGGGATDHDDDDDDEGAGERSNSGGGGGSRGADEPEWRQLKHAMTTAAAAAAVAPALLPASAAVPFGGPRGSTQLPSVQHAQMVAALWEAILERGLWRPHELLTVCVESIQAAPLELRAAVRRAAGEVLRELGLSLPPGQQ